MRVELIGLFGGPTPTTTLHSHTPTHTPNAVNHIHTTGVTEVATDVEGKRVVVTSAEAGPATAEAMLAALMKWCVFVLMDGGMGCDWRRLLVGGWMG